jgi:hypothetical protein
MTNQHPITPPPVLVQQWWDDFNDDFNGAFYEFEAITATVFQAGADQELEACCEWLQDSDLNVDTYKLRAARRPKLPSLKEQALVALHAVATGANDMREQCQDFETIRLALEQLDD